MQDRYVGDIGDYAKYALLRALGAGRRLGVAWYLHPDGGPPNDGRHIDYLDHPKEWRDFDPELFDVLRGLVHGQRNVSAVQNSNLLPNAAFADSRLCVQGVKYGDRAEWRTRWFASTLDDLRACDLVFADPDNGLMLDSGFKPSRQASTKSIPVCEVRMLAEGRPAVIYHHNTRRPGGHAQEVAWWREQLPKPVYAYRWRRWSSRTFFIVNADHDVKAALRAFAARWAGCGCLVGLKS